MAEMWYYTCEGKQMDPVPIRDLKRLIGDGVLKPTDMVWKDGMPRWIRASSVKDLFPDPSSSLDQYFSGPTVVPVDDSRSEPAAQKSAAAPRASSRPPADDDGPRPRRRSRRSAGDENDDRDRPRRRRPAPKSGGYGTQILIACLVGGFIVVGIFVVSILILARPRAAVPPERPVAVKRRPDDFKQAPPIPPPPPDQGNKAEPPIPDDVKTGTGVLPITVNLAPGAEHILKFRVRANHAATITVTPLPVPNKVVNLDMQVFKDSNNALIAADETPSPSASVAFTLPATEIVQVRVRNASKKTTVTQFTFVYNVGN